VPRNRLTNWMSGASSASGGEHVDEAREAALALVEVVGDVGGEVGLLAVLAHHHAVLLVAELGGAEPQCPFLAIQPVLRLEHAERVVDRAARGERALRAPAVEDHAELAQVLADVGEHRLERELLHLGEARGSEQLARARDERIDVGLLVAGGGIRRQPREQRRGAAPQGGLRSRGLEVGGERAHVVAAVAVLGKRQLLAAQLEIAHPGADREDVHLPAGVVDVVLAGHLEADGREDVGERRPVGRLAAVADVQRPGGICRDELHQHPLTAPAAALAVARALRVDCAELACVGRGRQVEVDEAGAGYLGARHQRTRRQRRDDRRRQLARALARGPGEAQRHVAGKIAVLRLARALDHHARRRGLLREDAAGEPVERGQQQLLEFLLHSWYFGD